MVGFTVCMEMAVVVTAAAVVCVVVVLFMVVFVAATAVSVLECVLACMLEDVGYVVVFSTAGVTVSIALVVSSPFAVVLSAGVVDTSIEFCLVT